MKRASWQNSQQASLTAPVNMANTPRTIKGTVRTHDPLIGQLLAARYTIESLIAEGGMASIYAARRINISDRVAIKIIDISQTDRSTTTLKRFQREAAAAAAISHPNVVTVHDFGVHEQFAFLVMELLEGPPLAHEIRVNGYFPPTRVTKIFRQICEGVAAAHKAGVIHRDLKPSNIIFQLENCQDDLIKVVDFGIAKPMPNQIASERLTAANVTLGTPEYMSPEQCLGEKIGYQLDQRSDIYSLGVMLYELLTGRVPFTNPVFTATIVQHAVAIPTRPSRVNTLLTHAIDTVVLKALEKNPEQRYGDVLEFAAEFEQVCNNFSQNNVSDISTRTVLAQRDTSTAISPEIAVPYANVAAAMERFVGRQEELHRLAERFQSIKNGTNSTVFIIGEPGSGKTALVNHFQNMVDPTEVIFLKGKFYEQGSDGPYRPYLDGLRSLLQVLPDNRMRAELEPLHDELNSSLETVEEMINIKISKGRVLEEQIKYRTFELLAQIYLMISEQLPIVLFLDDLQWADSLSLEFLGYLVRNSQSARIMFLGTSRIQELLDDSRAIKTWLRRFSQYTGFEQLRLTPLSEAEVASFVSTFFGNIQLPENTILRLREISGGNPYFLGEILRQLIQDEKIIWNGKEWSCANIDDLNLPDSILELLELNLRRLSTDMIETLMSAAVIGERFSLKLLQAITELPKDRLLNIIDDSLRESIITDIDFTGNDDYFLFHHSTLRQVLYQRLSATQRVSLHASIGRHLENRERFNTTDGELAYHMLQGEQFNKALYSCVMAGESAQSIFAVDEALKYYTWAETSLAKMLELGEQPKYGIAWLANYRLCYGTVLMHIGKNDDALQQFQLGLNMNKRVGLRPFEGKIWCAMGELCWSRGQYQQALNFCQTGLRLLSAMDDREGLSHLYAVMGDIHFSQGEFEPALNHYQQSLALSREIGNRSDEGEALRRIGSVMGCRRQAKSALDYLDQALAIARTIGNRQSEWLVIMLIGNIYLEQGELVCAAGYYRHARQIARAIGRRRGECRIAVNMGEVLRQQGDLESAKESYSEAREIAVEIEDREIEGHTLSNLGLLYQDLGELELAMLSFQQALDIFQSINYHSNVKAEALCGIAKILVQQNRLSEAKEYFLAAINSARDLEMWLSVIENLRALADCEFKLGNITATRDHLLDALVILNTRVCKTFDEKKQHQSLREDLEQEVSDLSVE